MKIYDCFPFFNELELLEIRLKELYPYVDYFVLVEATTTHSGKKKPLYFKENKKRFKKWEDKIIHIVVDLPKFNLIDKIVLLLGAGPKRIFLKIAGFGKGHGRWKLEHFQRTSIIEGLKKCSNNDIIIVSDIDEIINPKKVNKIKKLLEKEEIIKLEIESYFFYLNGKINGKGYGPKGCKFKILREKLNSNPHFLRSPKDSIMGRFGFIKEPIIIKNGGWHFSYLGGVNRIKEKIESFGHVEMDREENKNLKKIKKMIEEGNLFNKKDLKIDYIKIDKTFPKEIYENRRKYSKLIRN